jgi:hypothetical protein
VPLGALGLGLLLGVVTVAWGLGVPRAGGWLRLAAGLAVLAIVLKLLLWWTAPTYGLAASYFARARIGGEVERSTAYRDVPYTRVEQVPGQNGLAVHFFNDVERFNFYEPPDPDRRDLPFAVRWEGFLHVPADGAYPLMLTSRDVAALSLDGRPLLTVGGRGAEAIDAATVPLSAGPHALCLDLTHQFGPEPSLRVEVDVGDGPVRLGPPLVTVDAVPADVLARDRVLAGLAWGLDVAVVVAVLAVTALAFGNRARAIRQATDGRLALVERPLLAGLLLVILAYALATTLPIVGRAVVLEGGQDWLTYESYARDILLNGPLMTLGKPLGEGRPFFFQPFYPYYLAAMHWLAGEGVWGPIVLQLFGDGVAGVLVYALTRRLFGAWAAVAALALFLVLALSQLDWVARKLLSENLYFVVLPAAMLFVVRALDERRWRDVVWTGFLLGVASITRAPTLLFVPGAALVIALAWRRAGEPMRRAVLAFVLLGAVTASVAALVPIRNYVVSGRPTLVATNGGATLLLAHQPTERVRLSGIDRDSLYNALRLDRPTREVVEFARQDPVGYVMTLVPLGLYSVGVSGAVEGFPPLAPDILAVTLLYLAALVWLPGARSFRALPLHLFVVIHFAIMVTFLPYVYGYRQVLPMHLLMLVFDGALVARVLVRLADRGRGRRVADVSRQPVVEQRPA